MAILKRGEMSTSRYVTGGVIGTVPGFGLGHLVQQRWLERGWIFTAGELGSLTLVGVGLGECLGNAFSSGECNNSSLGYGILLFVAFKVWEFGDVWTTPVIRNREYRELRKDLAKRKQTLTLSPLLDQNKFGLGAIYQF